MFVLYIYFWGHSCQIIYSLKIWQAVREIYEIVPARKWEKEENRMNKIVFIGN